MYEVGGEGQVPDSGAGGGECVANCGGDAHAGDVTEAAGRPRRVHEFDRHVWGFVECKDVVVLKG